MQIKVPTLLVDEAKCKKNISRMVQKATQANAVLRPHFKTHHSAKIAEWYREEGVHQCTVSSVTMAHYFASHGWNDITIAFPYNPLEHEEINELAGKIKLNILLESEESARHASAHMLNPLNYFIKVDVGYHRTGIDYRDENAFQQIIRLATEKLMFKGFLAHAGHTYGAKSAEDIQWIYDKSEKALTRLREKFGGMLSYGDTPSCSIVEDLSAYDELRPGNFVFYDWMQHEIGSCTAADIAVCLVCPVVATHPQRNEIVIYGGAVHLSKDSLAGKNSRFFWKGRPPDRERMGAYPFPGNGRSHLARARGGKSFRSHIKRPKSGRSNWRDSCTFVPDSGNSKTLCIHKW